MAKRAGTRADALRTAVDQTFQAAAGQAQVTRDRAQELVEDLSSTATRVRDLIDDLRPASGDELKSLRKRISALERRVAELEGRPARSPAAAGRSSTAARRPVTARKAGAARSKRSGSGPARSS